MLKVEDSEVDRLLRIARRTRARILTSSSDENNSGNEQSSGLINLLFITFPNLQFIKKLLNLILNFQKVMLKTQKTSILWMKERRQWLKPPYLSTLKCRPSQYYRLYDKLLSGGVGEENLVLRNYKLRKFFQSQPFLFSLF